MKLSVPVFAVSFGVSCIAASPALAGFAGQTILGPLGPGSIVNGNTIGATDDNDGFTSGDHIFDLWRGPDDAWQLNWPGGDMHIEMTYDNLTDDLDLFLYEPGSYDDSSNYSILNTGLEVIDEPGAIAGTCYLVVDSDTAAHAGPYTLSVSPIPEPAGFSVAALIAAGAAMRRTR